LVVSFYLFTVNFRSILVLEGVLQKLKPFVYLSLVHVETTWSSTALAHISLLGLHVVFILDSVYSSHLTCHLKLFMVKHRGLVVLDAHKVVLGLVAL